MANPSTASILCGLLSTMEVLVTTDRAYVAHGRPVADCDSLAVWLERLEADEDANCSIVTRAVVHVTRFACAPTMDDRGNPLPAGVYEASAVSLLDDADALWYGAIDARFAGTLFGDDVSIECSTVEFGRGLVAIDPQGGMAGWDLIIRVTF